MDATELLARSLAVSRMRRDQKIAQQAGLPFLLKLEAYLPQCRKDAEIALRFSKT